jgi:uncharacterized protein YdhG (YjbR/CyaY superfamily)
MPGYATIDEYIAAQPADAQARLRELRAIARAVVPTANETISYGMPTYKFSGGALYFGAARRHCAIYGTVLSKFPDEVRQYDTSPTTGTLRLPLDQPVPEDFVRRLFEATVAERMSERDPPSR